MSRMPRGYGRRREHECCRLSKITFERSREGFCSKEKGVGHASDNDAFPAPTDRLSVGRIDATWQQSGKKRGGCEAGPLFRHQSQMNAIISGKKKRGGRVGSFKTNSRAGWYFHPWGLSTWIPSMESCSPAVSYLGSFVLKSSASRTVRSAGSAPPLDSSPPGAPAPFARAP